jgi:ABC-type nitrate/sulfonate/bicarbonate transport system ATPase subunit
MIAFRAVSKSYRGNGRGEAVPAVCNVDLRIGDSEFVCLLGPSGCGKSTLLNLAAGFIEPSEGHVTFDGRPVRQPGPDRGVVFQDPTLFPWLTVRQNVEFGLHQTGLSRRQRRQAALDGLRLVGFSGPAESFPHELSGGMRQRVALARVLALKPKALLMDEPFSSLDANSRGRLQNELLRIWEACRCTVLFVTHNVQEAAYLADRVVVMGFPPQSIVECVPVAIARGRSRTGPAMRDQVQVLRDQMDRLPCCQPTVERE